MIQAAGILYCTPDGKALFVKRGPGSDFPGCWAFPGGHVEPGETAIEAAKREAIEELGEAAPKGDPVPWTRAISPVSPMPTDPQAPAPIEAAAEPIDFTTFLAKTKAEFAPALNAEHTGYAWAPIGEPPEPLHPGCRIALDRFTMNELGVARAMAAGQLASPQRYENMWLFAIRVTGTGYSYRPPPVDEYVYRRPENYLTDDFLARCMGLPVIIEHTEAPMLDTAEYKSRNIGSVMLPYIQGDEVWTIARIYDEPAAEMMADEQLSTSPNVVFRSRNTNLKLEMEDGSTLLVEGDPDLLDHLAICRMGVWDKGGDPVGVNSAEARKDSVMTEDEKAAADKARKDAAEKEEAERKDAAARADAAALSGKIDNMLTALGSFAHRMDAFEEEMKKDRARKDASACKDCGEMHAADAECKKDDLDAFKAKKDAMGDPEKLAADKARKDAAEAEEKAKKDAEEAAMADARKDSVALAARLAQLEAQLKPVPETDRQALLMAQVKADAAYQAFGDRAPAPMPGEGLMDYRIRLARKLQAHSTALKGIAIDRIAIADAVGFAVMEDRIYADAVQVARSPSSVPRGSLRMRERASGGHIIREYDGEPDVWMRQFAGAARRLATGRFLTKGREH